MDPDLDMLNDHRHRASVAAPAAAAAEHEEGPSDSAEFRDIHALTPPSHPSRGRRRELWEGGSHRSSSLSIGSDAASEGFTTMSREFNAMVVAGSTMPNDGGNGGNVDDGPQNQLARIGEDELEETNPLAIVPDNNPFPSPGRPPPEIDSAASSSADEVRVHLVKKEEVESKISAWQTAEVAKINNRFKREEAIINGWESEQVEKATARLKKIERKLDEQRARAMEKMQNDVAKAHQKAAEKRASAEAKRGTKVAKAFELGNFLRAVGRAPSKRSFF
ncbi:remorin 4.1-like [Musa acuminata AAA Group]|uniref:remorin 4.1-like n=1 Tax=Musa acuminata AAA Group TaxID=214697 RepID=UPI0031E2D32F